MATPNPLLRFVKRQGVVILDGGLATTLEARGYDLNHELWSARLLLESPDAIRQLHADFLGAGADCIATTTYQATIAGFVKQGLDREAAVSLIVRSVTLAIEARDAFWGEETNHAGRERPLVAASVGPYGACLADGSEYTGQYDIDEERLFDFHLERWHILARAGADLLACETIPSVTETRALRRLLDETPNVWTWVSFSCRDGAHLNDGTPVVEAVATLKNAGNVAAVGINCTAPKHVESLIGLLAESQSHPIIVYPNSGECYDATAKKWKPTEGKAELPELARRWAERGASGIGGCCRFGVEDIAALRRALV